jgi:hypothetical protein
MQVHMQIAASRLVIFKRALLEWIGIEGYWGFLLAWEQEFSAGVRGWRA